MEARVRARRNAFVTAPTHDDRTELRTLDAAEPNASTDSPIVWDTFPCARTEIFVNHETTTGVLISCLEESKVPSTALFRDHLAEPSTESHTRRTHDSETNVVVTKLLQDHPRLTRAQVKEPVWEILGVKHHAIDPAT